MSYKTGFYEGRLGIGLSSTMGMGDGNPRYPLDINGDIRLTGSIVNGNGQVLSLVPQESLWTIGNSNLSYTGGNVGIGTTSPESMLHLKSTGDVILRLEADTDNTGENDNPMIFMSQDGPVSGNNQYFKIGMNGDAGTAFTGALGNGAYLSSNDHIQFAIQGEAVMTMKDNKNIGIGTTSPDSKLHIKGSSSDNCTIQLTNSNAGTGFMYIQRNDDGKSYVLNGSNHPLILGANNNTSQLYLKETGEVGLGMAPLQNYGTTMKDGFLTTNASGYHLIHAQAGAAQYGILDLKDLNSLKIRLKSRGDSYFNGGNVGIGTTDPGNFKLKIYNSTGTNTNGSNGWHNHFCVEEQTLAGSGITFKAGTQTGYIYYGSSTGNPWVGSGSFGFATTATGNSSDIKMVLKKDGNVGIGTTSPNAKLTIQNTNSLTNSHTDFDKFSLCFDSNDTEKRNGMAWSYYSSYGAHLGITCSNTTANTLELWATNGRRVNICAPSGNETAAWDHPGLTVYQNKVGIGTTSPGSKLTISHTRPTSITNSGDFYLGIGYNEHNHNSYRLIGFGYLSGTANVYPAYIGWKTTDNGGSTKGDLVFGTRDSTGATTVPSERMRIKSNGYVGIGTTDPKAKLEISGTMPYSSNASVSSTTTYLRFDANTIATSSAFSTSNYALAIKANGMIYSTSYIGASDKRIKENILDVSDNQALEILREIPCRYYEYKDKLERGKEKTIGFIAQEVREVMPMAINLQKDIIPNEMRNLSDISWNHTTLYTDLSDCSGIKYRFYVSNDISGNEIMREVVGNSDNSFTFDNSYNNVFCYGKEVDDFHTLDKQKLFALNFSATQELDKRVNVLESENAELKTKNTELENKVSTLESELAAIKQHLGI